MDDYRVKLGKYGEQLAAKYLERHGHKVTDKNFYTRYGEIDLIAQNGDEIIFCEVKTRTSSDCGYPEQAVDYYKFRKLSKTIQIYLQEKNMEKFWRLDVISVEINRDTKIAKIRWFKDMGIDK